MIAIAGPALLASPPTDLPTFGAPWQAKAFAMAVSLSKAGHFDWGEWVDVLSNEIKRSPASPWEGENEAYYRQWLGALERIVVTRGIVAAGETAERTEAWRIAYINTPHGQAVDLVHATCPPAHAHHAVSRGLPIAISAAAPRTP